MHRTVVIALPLLTLLLALSAAPSRAADEAPPGGSTRTAGRDAAPPADAGLRLAGPSVREPTRLDRPTIYRILCGGSMANDGALSRHLWAVAGSLADGDWTPPRVTIRVIVSPPSPEPTERSTDG